MLNKNPFYDNFYASYGKVKQLDEYYMCCRKLKLSMHHTVESFVFWGKFKLNIYNRFLIPTLVDFIQKFDPGLEALTQDLRII